VPLIFTEGDVGEELWPVALGLTIGTVPAHVPSHRSTARFEPVTFRVERAATLSTAMLLTLTRNDNTSQEHAKI
jgi:hypothetical protein